MDIYYIQNGELPISNDALVMSQDDVLELSSKDVAKNGVFLLEMEENKDKVEDGTQGKYYMLDLSKIGITKSKYGLKKYGENDVYIVSSNRNVYYLKGIEIEKNIYYSLTSRLVPTISIENNQEVLENQTSTTSNNLIVKKDTNVWSNKMGITVNAYLEKNDELYIKIPNIEQKKITASLGNNIFEINSFEDVISGVSTLKIENLTEDEIKSFNELTQENKIIYFVIKENLVEKSRVKVNLSNYETSCPTYTQPEVSYADDKKTITFSVSDDNSNIKEVKYMYLEKYNLNSEVENLIDGKDDVDFNIIYTLGESIKVDKDGKVILEVGNDVLKVKVLILDNALNWTSLIISTSDR